MFNIVINSDLKASENKPEDHESHTETSSFSNKSFTESSFHTVKYQAPVYYEGQNERNNVEFVQQSYMKLLELMGINGMKQTENPSTNIFDQSTKPKIECANSKRAINEIENSESTMVNELENNDDTKQSYIKMLDSVGVIIKNFTMLQSHIKNTLESHSKVRVVCVEDLSNIDMC